MKIKTKILSTFLKKVLLTGEQQIEESILRFEKDGLKINANSSPKQVRVMGWLKASIFKEYEEIGNIGINDFNNVIKVIDRFGEFITMKVEGQLLTISGDNKKVEIELIKEDFLSTDTGEPTLEFQDTFSITGDKLKDYIKDVEMNKDSRLTIITEDKKVSFSNSGKYKFLNTFVAPTCKGGIKVTFGQPFIDSVRNLDGVLEVSIKSDYPAKVLEKTEESSINIIVAPVVEEE